MGRTALTAALHLRGGAGEVDCGGSLRGIEGEGDGDADGIAR